MSIRKRLATILIIMLVVAGCDATTNPAPASGTIGGRQNPPGKLLWSDEFDGSAGSSPDSSIWTPDVGGNGWGNQELEYYTDNQNDHQDGHGNLVLEAHKGNPDQYSCWYGTCKYTSARISTKDRFSFTYGRIESRIKIAYGHGIWPAFWLLGSNCATVKWPACGEIDVMENKGEGNTSSHSASHGPGTATVGFSYDLPHGTFTNSFHNFALQWDPSHLYFSVDGTRYATLDKASLTNQQDWVFNHPFNIVLNIAVGGKWFGNPDATTTFPQKMYVDYVRLYSI